MSATRTTASRRRFLQGSAALGGGLALAFHLPFGGRLALAETPAAGAKKPTVKYPPNAFVHIASDETVTVMCKHSEMGQGILTTVAMLLADELDCDWSKVRVLEAPNAPVYDHTAYGMQMTGGSTSTSDSWLQMRTIGAQLRTMLEQAAAARWHVDAADCHAADGYVVHAPGGRRASFGSLAAHAAKLPVPTKVTLKDPSRYRIIGTSPRRLDAREKTDGSGLFGFDVRLPNMLYAVVARPPVFGGRLARLDASAARKVTGVRDVVQIASGVAVVATGVWAAIKGRNALDVEWHGGPAATLSSAAISSQYRMLAEQPGAVAETAGDVTAALAGAAKRIEAVYEVPYLAHAPMEPLNCVAHVVDDSCEIWCGTQFQTMDAIHAAEVAGIKPGNVTIHTMLLGGGFGRRANPDSDFVREAVAIAKVVGQPVMTVWTREDDIQGGWYRPAWLDRLVGGLDRDGRPVAWQHRIVGQSILTGTPFEKFLVKDGVDATSVEGAVRLPYRFATRRVELQSPKQPVPVQWWRSVGHSHTAFAVESFIDELATAAGKDPLAFRRALLDPAATRHRAVLDLVAEKSGWGGPLPRGRARGLALHASFGSVVAQVAEVSIEGRNAVVHRVVSAVHCGTAVDPDGVRQQIEGATIFGLSAALYGQITLQNGRVQQGNFNDYPVLRMDAAPAFDTYIVPSTAKPTGIGEPGTPLIAAVLCNALAALTGRRIRTLPLSTQGFDNA